MYHRRSICTDVAYGPVFIDLLQHQVTCGCQRIATSPLASFTVVHIYKFIDRVTVTVFTKLGNRVAVKDAAERGCSCAARSHGQPARHQRRAAWAAHVESAVPLRETNALPGELVDVRRQDARVAVAREIAVPEIILKRCVGTRGPRAA